ncbi:LysM peptidoglycan-binding domain-containing protein [Pedobacter jejuensis]|uniref:LysM peptidoglycan-binding domain-containing protein n=1 Tax=Pedobacter jejuensis TaxID=1268550 RepID=A0A3N0C1M7_9SPHI|nr:LysM peptidoglycan-binding domain-containing protein [Pedobacter jejuensis]RNL56096.1 LysM peptidoglycan-binding domain-containing protein [Pedobacter jejuensis]
MYKIGLSAIVLLALNVATAKANALIDSIGVENNNGKKLIIHQTAAKDTYYAIGRRYNVAPKDIMAFNENKYLQIGVIIKVPTNIPFVTTSGNTQQPANTPANVTEHVVKPKDNLNMLAEKYGTTVNELKALNNLKNINLSIGQVLKIPVKNGEAVQAQPTVIPVSKTEPTKPVEQVVTTQQTKEMATQTLVEHIVQPKEFLGKIAEKYRTTVDEIRKLNNLSGNNLRIGQKLKIPATKNVEGDKVVTTVETVQIGTEVKDATGTHTVKKGESIFKVAQQYGITAYQIRRLNNLSDNTLNTGQVLKIPTGITTEIPVVKEKTVEVIVKDKDTIPGESFLYTVGTGETIFNIAKKFNLTAYQIRTANKLNDNAITVGQKLIIPRPPEPKSVNDLSKQEQEVNPDSTAFKDPKLRGAPSKYGLNQIEEKGTAVSITDADLDASKMLVLHRTAPIGTIIKLTNPMTNRTALAKVVGKFTENESTKDVIIVMTKAVADSLGALDKRFFCNLTYGVHELE